MNSSAVNLKVELSLSDENVSIGTWGDIFFTSWKADADVNTANQVGIKLLEFTNKKQDGVVIVNIIKPRAKIPKSDVRSIMAKILPKTNIIASTTIVEGKGFRAAAVLGFISSLSLLAKHPYPQKAFDTIHETSEWLLDTANTKGVWRNLTASQVENAIMEFKKNSEKAI